MGMHRDSTSEWNKERQALKTMTTSKPSNEIKGHPPVTTLIENGADMKDVQTRLGHAHLGTTADTYTHVTAKMQNKTIDIFEKALHE